MSHIPKIEIKPYKDILFRRKWNVIVLFSLAIVGGLLFFKIAPKVYRATTLILVEPQQVPDSYVRSVISGTVEKRLQTISQQIHSRTNLEKIIDQFGLDREPAESNRSVLDRLKEILKMDETVEEGDEAVKRMSLVQELRKKIQVTLRGGRENSAFEISFIWNDGAIAAQVANFVANKFIEENLNVREEMAMATTDFLEREASRIRYELEAKEKELEDFKKEHMGMLPSELESNISILNQLREELNNLEKRLDTEKQMAIMLENQTKTMKSAMSSDLFVPFEDDALAVESSSSGKVQMLEEQLENLKVQYTDKHPDIVALKKRIERAKKEEEDNQAVEEEQAFEPEPEIAIPTVDPMASQLKMARDRIQSYVNQIEELKKRIGLYQERVEGTPRVELAMTKILRDYETVKSRYEELLSKSLSARMAEELERRQKGEQFRIIDPAIAPGKPFSPDIKKVMLMAVVAGLAMGAGLAYVREILDPCFYSPEEIESELNTNVVVSLPYVDLKQNARDDRKKSKKRPPEAA